MRAAAARRPIPNGCFIKHRDEFASPKIDAVGKAVTSVKTGRTMEQIANGRGRVWRSDQKTTSTARKKTATKKSAKTTGKTTSRRRIARRQTA